MHRVAANNSPGLEAKLSENYSEQAKNIGNVRLPIYRSTITVEPPSVRYSVIGGQLWTESTQLDARQHTDFFAGIVHSLEVATLQGKQVYKADTIFEKLTEMLEQMLLLPQVALFLFALRRRFHR
jgi:hypothetical protein